MSQEQAFHRAARIASHLTSLPPPVGPTPKRVSGNSASPLNDNDVVIVGYARTAIGMLNGTIASVTAPQLGSIAIKAAMTRAKVNGDDIDCVYMGNVLQAAVGQAPARQAAMGSGISPRATCTTINKVCASGMKAITLAASEIMLGTALIGVAGGMESMSSAPYALPKVRQGLRLGGGEMIDVLQHDGLRDPFGKYLMGVIAEKTAEKHNITRQDQDQYAQLSYTRSLKAQKEGTFSPEIVPVELPTRPGQPPKALLEDEMPRSLKVESIPTLKGVFGRGQTVTAGNASGINDGASAVVLMSAKVARERGLKPLAVIRSWADAETIPDDFPTAPSLAIPIALKRARLATDQIDLWELNEAFAVVAIANTRILGIPVEKTNVAGGGVSLGHPIGSSGCRIVCTLLNLLLQRALRYGCAAICNGGGGATAIVIERL